MSTVTAKITAEDLDNKLAERRFRVLELARELGSVTEACRRAGIDRTSFYEWKRRFQTLGWEGLKDLPPAIKNHPQTTTQETVDRVLDIALQHPHWGCNKISDDLEREGISLSSVTVQNVLIKHQLGSRGARLLKLEEKALTEKRELTAEQTAQIEKANPIFKERHFESSRPGELLCQDNFYVGHLIGVGKVYLHTVVDTYGSYAFGLLHTSKQPEAAVALLQNEVALFYQEREIPIGSILTDNGREYCGIDSTQMTHPFERYLSLNGIRHDRTEALWPQTNGFVVRFHSTVLDEFFHLVFRTKPYLSVSELQADLDVWLHTYNWERLHVGYRNLGKRPIDTVNAFLLLPDWRERCLAPALLVPARQ